MEISPTIFVIFGGAGDLTWRKLIPSLFDLHRDRRMPKQFAIMAVDRAALRDAQVHKRFLDGVNRFSPKGTAKSTDWKYFLWARHLSTRRFQRPGNLHSCGEALRATGEGVESESRSCISPRYSAGDGWGDPKNARRCEPESGSSARPDCRGKTDRTRLGFSSGTGTHAHGQFP